MDTFVDSSWYYLRYLSPGLADAPFDTDTADEWLPVDVYVGGEEHAVLHLLYIRFFTRALADLDLLDRREPVETLLNQGTVLHGGSQMSKSKGNAVAPHEYGAETTRLFVLSAAHPERDFEWTAMDVSNAYAFQQEVYDLVATFADGADRASDAGGDADAGMATRLDSAPQDAYLEREIDRTIAAVTDEYDRFRFHQVTTELQSFVATLRRYVEYDTPYRFAYSRALRTLAKLVAPLAPYLAEELWRLLDGDGLMATAEWPTPLQAVSDYTQERALIQRTLADIRDIIDVVDIAAPERIALVVAEDWKYEATEIVREALRGDEQSADGGDVGAAVEAVRAASLDVPADRAAGFAAALAEREGGLEPALGPDHERTILKQAAWRIESEFGTAVTVRQATRDGELADSARPGKPAIQID
jgi:leucyl-tRNA synthetase